VQGLGPHERPYGAIYKQTPHTGVGDTWQVGSNAGYCNFAYLLNCASERSCDVADFTPGPAGEQS